MDSHVLRTLCDVAMHTGAVDLYVVVVKCSHSPKSRITLIRRGASCRWAPLNVHAPVWERLKGVPACMCVHMCVCARYHRAWVCLCACGKGALLCTCVCMCMCESARFVFFSACVHVASVCACVHACIIAGSCVYTCKRISSFLHVHQPASGALP